MGGDRGPGAGGASLYGREAVKASFIMPPHFRA